MWKKFDSFRTWVQLQCEITGFWPMLGIIFSIPAMGFLLDWLTDINVFAMSILCFYAVLGLMSSCRDLMLHYEKTKQEERAWKRKNIPPYEGF
jgi:hypothetical protein